ncbi:MAG: hypothetical protein JWM68_1684, partial [Verrucomicrobiales bacterium]|nr:hypothetical protein [Verrucomicrobiales bacterium]
MRMVQPSPIKRKLQHVIMLTSLISLLLACAGFVAYDYLTFRRFMVADLSTLADMLAVNVQSALVFDDSQSAENTLVSLRSRSGITSAAVYKLDHGLLATYVRPGTLPGFPSTPEQLSYRFERERLIVYSTVISNNKPVGVVFLESELEKLYARFRTYAEIALLLLLISGFVAFVLSTRLQKRVSEPILELAQTAKTISERKDFGVRAVKRAEDEIGLLAQTFNEMLAQIQERDNALLQSNDALSKFNQELEERVQQRTAALNESNEQMQIFTYSVAHDLRAPLRSVKGFSEAVLEDYGARIDKEGLEYLQRILKSVDHMDMIIQDLLVYSCLSREELRFEIVQLRRIIENALS